MKTTTRDYSIDRLRILLTMLVIFHHSAIAFGAGGGWYYASPAMTSGTTQLLAEGTSPFFNDNSYI